MRGQSPCFAISILPQGNVAHERAIGAVARAAYFDISVERDKIGCLATPSTLMLKRFRTPVPFKAGPVTTYGDGTCFYAVMHGTISDNTGGKIAMVTPSFYVHELFATF